VEPVQILAIIAAGFAAGTINTIVGSGSLITFPTLLAFGYPPVLANVTNTIGVAPGSISGAFGYRRELLGQRSRVISLTVVGALGGLTGGILLLVLPESAFDHIVPILILFAVVLVALQPRLARLVALRRLTRAEDDAPPHRDHPWLFLIAMFLASMYGGYFGAGQGVIYLALMAIFIADNLQRLNAAKNVVAAVVNSIAAVLFALVAPVDWPAAILLAIGATLGGQVGAHLGRRLSPFALRAAIIVIGTIVGVRLLIT
jgi:uncharacterized membrane protein YfcA